MLMEVYYEHYAENCRGRYWEMEPKQTPYMVLIKDAAKRNGFKAYLTEKGFRCVGWNQDYPGVLVNMKLRRFALITKACKHSCVDDRNFTLDEFISKVFNPWEVEQAKDNIQGGCQHGCQ